MRAKTKRPRVNKGFGEISNGEMNLNEAGTLINENWIKLENTYDNIIIDYHVVMPNHFHGIIWLEESNNIILGQIIGAFKCFTTTAYIKGVRDLNWPPFQRRLWQRNFYERIIRDDKELEDSRRYILDNPAKWKNDEYNVHRGDDNDEIPGGKPDPGH
jgi:REP element-mobilizing transposase RayT